MTNINEDTLTELLYSKDEENKKLDIWSVSPFSSVYRSFNMSYVFELMEKYGAIHYFTNNAVNVIIEYDKNGLKNFPINGYTDIAR